MSLQRTIMRRESCLLQAEGACTVKAVYCNRKDHVLCFMHYVRSTMLNV